MKYSISDYTTILNQCKTLEEVEKVETYFLTEGEGHTTFQYQVIKGKISKIKAKLKHL